MRKLSSFEASKATTSHPSGSKLGVDTKQDRTFPTTDMVGVLLSSKVSTTWSLVNSTLEFPTIFNRNVQFQETLGLRQYFGRNRITETSPFLPLVPRHAQTTVATWHCQMLFTNITVISASFRSLCARIRRKTQSNRHGRSILPIPITSTHHGFHRWQTAAPWPHRTADRVWV